MKDRESLLFVFDSITKRKVRELYRAQAWLLFVPVIVFFTILYSSEFKYIGLAIAVSVGSVGMVWLLRIMPQLVEIQNEHGKVKRVLKKRLDDLVWAYIGTIQTFVGTKQRLVLVTNDKKSVGMDVEEDGEEIIREIERILPNVDTGYSHKKELKYM